MFFQNAMGVQTLRVTHGDNAQSQHSRPQGPGSCRSPTPRSLPGIALPPRRVLHPPLPPRLPELPRFAPAKICRIGQEKGENSDANPAKGAPSIPAALAVGRPLGMLSRGRTGGEAASALTSAGAGMPWPVLSSTQELRQLLLRVHPVPQLPTPSTCVKPAFFKAGNAISRAPDSATELQGAGSPPEKAAETSGTSNAGKKESRG